MPFLILTNLGKVTQKIAIFNLLPYFGNYIKNPAKIFAMLKFGNVFLSK